ncbi:PRC-barrel domain-containing protein [Salipiger sp. PrR003]|uniref:PRC-barrel domain-containing protein n=1 Tax=Salipiger sp. PrR003 TaxID=2706776 RepID=UPI0013DB397B|nr:PRC-barrel domain-containing protein [Salipiger sp. PrR003]NDV49263.1 PRC-barrel domain containing protein [Salipiger sp. PrR003]
MKRKFLMTVGSAMLAALPVAAQDSGAMFLTQTDEDAVLATELMDMRVYRSDEPASQEGYEGVQENWDDIGEVGDIVLSREGQLQAVVLDIGGFLGMGEHPVAVDMSSLTFAPDTATDATEDFFLLLNADQAALEDAPAFEAWNAASGAEREAMSEDRNEPGEMQEMNPADQVGNAATNTPEPTNGTGQQAGGTPLSTDPAAENTDPAADATLPTTESNPTSAETGETDAMDGDSTPTARRDYVAAGEEDLTAETLTGAAVYGSNDEEIGEVSEIILDDDGTVRAVIVDVGGFLGLGEKPVELQLSDLQIARSEDASSVVVYVPMTQDELEALPAYEG